MAKSADYYRLLAISTLTKLSDLLVSPKTTLPWLVTLVGAPAWVLPMIVPIKESGSLIPQWHLKPFLAEKQRSVTAMWRIGCVVQGAALGLLPVAALLLEGISLGIGFLALLALAALGRSLCSLTFKLVQADTVNKGDRGKLVGLASSLSAAVTIAVSGLMLSQSLSDNLQVLLWLIAAGALLFGFAVMVSAPLTVKTSSDAPESQSLANIWRDKKLKHLVLNRLLSAHAALIVPLLVASTLGQGQSDIYWFVLLAALASLVSSYLWGLLADRTALTTLRLALLTCLIGVALQAVPTQHTDWVGYLSFTLFALGHAGIRTARKTYVLDISNEDNRALYVAAGNTCVGWCLLALGGLYAAASAWFSQADIMLFMGAMMLVALAHTLLMRKVD